MKSNCTICNDTGECFWKKDYFSRIVQVPCPKGCKKPTHNCPDDCETCCGDKMCNHYHPEPPTCNQCDKKKCENPSLGRCELCHGDCQPEPKCKKCGKELECKQRHKEDHCLCSDCQPKAKEEVCDECSDAGCAECWHIKSRLSKRKPDTKDSWEEEFNILWDAYELEVCTRVKTHNTQTLEDYEDVNSDGVECEEIKEHIRKEIVNAESRRHHGINKLVRSFLDHKENGRREYSLDEQRAYNRAIFDLLKALSALEKTKPKL